jgi:hypothetical protein
MNHCSHKSVAWQIDSMRKSLAQQEGLPFADLLTPELLRQVSREEARSSEPVYTPLVTLEMFIGQQIDSDRSCRQAVTRLAAWLASQKRPTCGAETGGYCKARARLCEDHLQRLVQHTGSQLHQRIPTGWQWKGHRVKIADGTTATMPDTQANQEAYPQPVVQKPGLGFPMVRMVVLFCLSTGAALAAALGKYAGKGMGELSLFRSIWDSLQPGEVLLADRLYCSWFEMALLRRRGVHMVLHKHQSRQTDFRRGTWLGSRDHLVRWRKPDRPEWMDEQTYASLPSELEVRELRGTVNEQGFRPTKLILITTLLDEELYRPEELAKLYCQRWQSELDLRSLKETLQMGQLRCKTPAMVRKEIWVHLLAYNLIRGLIAQASVTCERSPCQVSFSGAMQTFRAFQHGLRNAQGTEMSGLYQSFLEWIAAYRVGDRPGRVEPRAKKRRKKNYPVLTEPRAKARKRLMKAA